MHLSQHYVWKLYSHPSHNLWLQLWEWLEHDNMTGIQEFVGSPKLFLYTSTHTFGATAQFLPSKQIWQHIPGIINTGILCHVRDNTKVKSH